MGQAHPRSLSNVPPGGITLAWIDETTGLGSDQSCAGAIQAPFRSGYAPLPGPGCEVLIDTEGLKKGANKVLDTIRGWLQ